MKTLADHAEAWTRENGNPVPERDTPAWTAMKPTIRIRALWTQYGPRFHCRGRNTDCVSDCDTWTLAVYDLEKWIERHHPGHVPEFYGPSAESAEQAWARLKFYDSRP